MDDKLEKMLIKTQATGEPTFTVRAQDRHSVAALRAYRNAVEEDNNVSDEFCREIDRFVSEFEEWQAANPDKVKSPD